MGHSATSPLNSAPPQRTSQQTRAPQLFTLHARSLPAATQPPVSRHGVLPSQSCSRRLPVSHPTASGQLTTCNASHSIQLSASAFEAYKGTASVPTMRGYPPLAMTSTFTKPLHRKHLRLGSTSCSGAASALSKRSGKLPKLRGKRRPFCTLPYTDKLTLVIRADELVSFCAAEPPTSSRQVLELLLVMAKLFDKYRTTPQVVQGVLQCVSDALWKAVPRMQQLYLTRVIQILPKLHLQPSEALWARLVHRAGTFSMASMRVRVHAHQRRSSVSAGAAAASHAMHEEHIQSHGSRRWGVVKQDRCLGRPQSLSLKAQAGPTLQPRKKIVSAQPKTGRRVARRRPMKTARDHAAWLHSLMLMQMLSSGAAKGLWPTAQQGELIFHDLDDTVCPLA
jgi:VanZ family protein